ncbi:nucleotide-binding universal stress UspA family protein [Paraburkholderia sp. GV068]|jgi:nucleotide-binding universal stress UspA family protein|uniref:universal stress protein n=1 Tax=Paraburkholderia TaxID=1822464 RepID=UPI000D302749|nr:MULTISPECIES: universal stress protein [unclassified Paraburkholderia]PTQ93074.1 nucleotide-binding universal stress UspA family protein [Paraburkholderia sp. GV072]PUA99805.1 nucleotide-binding universal stress UspA family protein [Paraburkholderia sp. GV068]
MYANIVVALDGSDAAKRALSEAIQLAKLSRGKLTAVYVLDQSAAFTYAGACDPHLLTDAARQVGTTLLHAALEQMRELNVVGDTEIVETQGIAEDIAGALLRCAQRRGADLVVIGTHGRRGLRRMVIGSVAERFVRCATCPVLLVREPADAKREASV